MRAQVSAEFLVVMAVAFAALALIVPNVQKAKSAGDELLNARAAAMILDAAGAACERALITGEGRASIHAPRDYVLRGSGGKLSISFGNRSIERNSSACSVEDRETTIAKGTAALVAKNNGAFALLRPEPKL